VRFTPCRGTTGHDTDGQITVANGSAAQHLIAAITTALAVGSALRRSIHVRLCRIRMERMRGPVTQPERDYSTRDAI
jgi:hypothetical protein